MRRKGILYTVLVFFSLHVFADLSWEKVGSSYDFETVFPLNIVILDSSKWTKEEVIERVRTTERIYSQCQVSFWPIQLAIEHRPNLASFDYLEAGDLYVLRELNLKMRPLIFFMNKNTSVFADPAWAWIDSSKTEDFRKRVGYVFHSWKRVERIDLELFAGITNYEVLAHELGHILLNHGPHLDEPGNVMSSKTAPMGDQLNREQCQVLRERARLF